MIQKKIVTGIVLFAITKSIREILMIVTCEYCNKEFNRNPASINRRIFCSVLCFHETVKTDKTLNGRYAGGRDLDCVICGKEHYRTPSAIKSANGHPTCCQKCHGVWLSKHMVGEKAPNYQNSCSEIVCPYCNKKFTQLRKDQKYCSRECGNSDQGIRNRVDTTCFNCGKIFSLIKSTVKFNKLRDHKNTFCSIKCRSEWYSGKNSSGWIKDRSELKDQNKSVRCSKKMADWRKLVYERDDYTCVLCGDRRRVGNRVVLNAHHIKPFSTTKTLRFDINNGVTLCEPCHKLTYSKESKYEKILLEYIECHPD